MIRRGLLAALLIVVAIGSGFLIANSLVTVPLMAGAADPSARPTGQPPQLQNPQRDILSPAQQASARRSGLLPAGVRSLLPTEGVMRHGDFRWNDEGVAAGPLTIWIDLRTQLISVFRDGHEIGTAVIVYGDDTMESPLGRFPILSKHRDYHSRAYDAPMPHSLFITDTGVALHGSPMSSRRATHGCIGLPDKFAQRLFDAASIGDSVEIIRSADIGAPRRPTATKS